MSDEELDDYIERIKNWLFDFPKHKNYKRVQEAFNLALTAKRLREEDDPLLTDVIDLLTDG